MCDEFVVHSAYGVCFIDSVDCSAVKKDSRYIFELVDRCIAEIGGAKCSSSCN